MGVQCGYSFWEKKCSSSPLSERTITYRTVMLLLGGHTYLHFCLNWQRQCRQLKHNNPRQCQAGGLSALGTCHRNRFGAALHWSHPDRLLCVNPSKEVLQWMLNPNLQKCKDVCLEIERVERLDWILVEGYSYQATYNSVKYLILRNENGNFLYFIFVPKLKGKGSLGETFLS